MSAAMTFKRKELKYFLSDEQKAQFIDEIKDHIQADAFAKYTICNVYYDTPDSRLIRRSIEKPCYKEKMRMRSYGAAQEDSKVFIELKKKYDGIVYKRRIAMGYEEAGTFFDGKSARNGQVESEINYFIEMYDGIEPAMYIAYDREAYSGIEDASLRITFDDNVLWRDKDVRLSSEVYGNPILEEGQNLLEIKCAEAMPLWLVHALNRQQIYKTSFSKYGKAYATKVA